MTKEKKNVSQAILDAAYLRISLEGYANVSLRDIAKEAGVALSQLHYYFGSKQSLFKEIIIQMKNRYVMEFRHRVSKVKTSEEKMDALIELFQHILIQEPGLMRLFFDLYSLSLWSEEFRHLLSSLVDELSEIVANEVISTLTTNDQLYGASKDQLSKLIVGAVFGIAMQYTLNPEDNHQLIEGFRIVPKIIKE